MPKKKLKNAPLKEAIFELFWQLPLDGSNFPTDPELTFAVGKFQSLLKDTYPINKSLDSPGGSLRIYPKPSYQFWKGEMEWPVIQLGHGLLTINDTDKNYVWESTYKPNIEKAITVLQKAYERKPNFNKVRLTYINAVDFDPQTQAPSDFISENLLTPINTNYELPGKEINMWISRTFSIEKVGSFQINIQNGINNANGKPSIIWTTVVEQSGNFSVDDIYTWLDNAHNITSSFFVKMLKPEFYETFD